MVRETERRFRCIAKGQGNKERENKRQKKWKDRKRLARVVEHGSSEPVRMNI